MEKEKETPSDVLIRKYLGKNYISLWEVQVSRGLVYHSEQILSFYGAIMSGHIEWCLENDGLFLPGPPEPLTLEGVRDLNPGFIDADLFFFFEKKHGEYSGKKRAPDVVQPGLLAVRKTAFPGSLDLIEPFQKKLLPERERVPNAPELLWALTTLAEVQGVFLLEGVSVRTSSRSFSGRDILCITRSHSSSLEGVKYKDSYEIEDHYDYENHFKCQGKASWLGISTIMAT